MCCSSGGAQEKRKDRMKLSLPPKLVEKTSLGLGSQLLFPFVKIFIPGYAFDGLLCRNWPFSPPSNHLTFMD